MQMCVRLFFSFQFAESIYNKVNKTLSGFAVIKSSGNGNCPTRHAWLLKAPGLHLTAETKITPKVLLEPFCTVEINLHCYCTRVYK